VKIIKTILLLLYPYIAVAQGTKLLPHKIGANNIAEAWAIANNSNNCDSVIAKILALCEFEPNSNNLKTLTLENYFAYDGQNAGFAKAYLNEAIKSKKKNTIADAYLILAELNYTDSIGAAKIWLDEANTIVQTLNDNPLKARANTIAALLYFREGKYLDAFKKISTAKVNAKLIDEKTIRSKILLTCLELEKQIFIINNDYVKQKEITEEMVAVSNSNLPDDSTGYLRSLIYLAQSYYYLDDKDKAYQMFKEVGNIAISTKNKNIQDNLGTIIRSSGFEKNDVQLFKKFYVQDYPFLLEQLRSSSYFTYCRVKASITEADGNTDSAKIYWSLAEKNPELQTKNSYQQATFYKRLGDFYFRIKDIPKATEILNIAYQQSINLNYYLLTVNICNALKKVYLSTNNYTEAYKFQGLELEYKEKVSSEYNSSNQLNIMLDNQKELDNLNAVKTEIEKNRKKNIQYMLAVILLLAFFTILAVLSAYPIPKIIIRGVAFISFIFFFEFIILLIDNWLHHATHGAPLPILGAKIVLISILLPLHHWVEHKVLHYLHEHKGIGMYRLKNWIKKNVETLKKQNKDN
jgi:hypothetical protein